MPDLSARVHYQLDICFAAHSSVVLKAETVADKVEWIKKISKVIQPSKGVPRGAPAEGGPTMRQSLSDGSLVSYFSHYFCCDKKSVRCLSNY